MFFNWTRNLLLKPSLVRCYQHRIQKKGVWKERISIVYLFFATSAFIVVGYSVVKGKSNWVDYYGLRSEEEKSTPVAVQWAPILGVSNAKVYQYRGFTKISEYDINSNTEAVANETNSGTVEDKE